MGVGRKPESATQTPTQPALSPADATSERTESKARARPVTLGVRQGTSCVPSSSCRCLLSSGERESVESGWLSENAPETRRDPFGLHCRQVIGALCVCLSSRSSPSCLKVAVRSVQPLVPDSAFGARMADAVAAPSANDRVGAAMTQRRDGNLQQRHRPHFLAPEGYCPVAPADCEQTLRGMPRQALGWLAPAGRSGGVAVRQRSRFCFSSQARNSEGSDGQGMRRIGQPLSTSALTVC